MLKRVQLFVVLFSLLGYLFDIAFFKKLSLDPKVYTFSKKRKERKEKAVLWQQCKPDIGSWETTAMSRQEVLGIQTDWVAAGMGRPLEKGGDHWVVGSDGEGSVQTTSSIWLV